MKKIQLFILIIVTGCGGKAVNIENFDQQAWKEDSFGCNDSRADMVNSLMENKKELLGRSNGDIIDYLGKPDKTELYVRNQKFFHYYITPGEQCGDGFPSQAPAILTFRFNATGLVKEITLYY